MITGIGTDIVEVTRFIPWITAPASQQGAIFSEQEIADCITEKADSQNIAERLAARFAAKEAFYKALSATLGNLSITPKQQFSLMFTAQHISVTTDKLGTPTLSIFWEPFFEKIGQPLPLLTIHLSIAHEKTHALAFVVISRQD